MLVKNKNYFLTLMISCVLLSMFSFNHVLAAEVDEGLLLHYEFNQTEGDLAIDSSGNGYDAQLKGGASWDDGRFGGAIRLDGDGAYLQLPDGIFSDVEEATISIWVNQDRVRPWQRVFDFGSGPERNFFLTLTSGWEDTHLSFNDGFSSVLLGAWKHHPGLNSLENWRHIAVTIADGTGKLYVDGQEVIADDYDVNFNNLEPTTQNYLGKSQHNDPYYEGRIDDFRIYNRALSRGEIWRVYDPTIYGDTETLEQYGGN